MEAWPSGPSLETGASRSIGRRRGWQYLQLCRPPQLTQLWGVDPKEKSMFLMTNVSDTLRLSSRNISTLKMLMPRTLNLYVILNFDKLLLTLAAVDYLNSRYGVNAYEGEDEEEYEGDEGEEGQEGTEVDTNSDATE